MLYKNTKVRSPDVDTDYFDIVPGMLQGDTLAPYLFIICLDYVLRTTIDLMKEGFSQAKKEAEYTPHKLLREQTTLMTQRFWQIHPQAESLLHTLEWVAGGIGLHVNTDKTEYTCFNQRGDISTLNSGPLKLVDKFTYLEVESHQPKMTTHD